MLPEILSVSVEGGEAVLVPLTPVTTFKDVSACVREPGDPLPLILEESPLGARVVPGWERPLELLRLWGNFRDQVKYNASFSLSRQLRDESYLKNDLTVKSRSRSRTPDSTSIKYGNIDPWELYELRDDLKDLLLSDSSFLNESSSHSESADAFDSPSLYKTKTDAVLEDLNIGFVSNPSEPKDKARQRKSTGFKTRRTDLDDSSSEDNCSNVADLNKENEGQLGDTDESHLLWTSFNSHTKDKRYRKRIRRSHMTEAEQNNHLQSLLQESRLASIYGSPFRRGVIQTCSFPNNTSKQYDFKRLKAVGFEERSHSSSSNIKSSFKDPLRNGKGDKRLGVTFSNENRTYKNSNLNEFTNQDPKGYANDIDSKLELLTNSKYTSPSTGNVPSNSIVFKRVTKNPCKSPDCHDPKLSAERTSYNYLSNWNLPNSANPQKFPSKSPLPNPSNKILPPGIHSSLSQPNESSVVLSTRIQGQSQGRQIKTNNRRALSPQVPQQQFHSTMSPVPPKIRQENQNPNIPRYNITTQGHQQMQMATHHNTDQSRRALSPQMQNESPTLKLSRPPIGKSIDENQRKISSHETNFLASQTLPLSPPLKQKPLSPKLKQKMMSPKQLKKGRQKAKGGQGSPEQNKGFKTSPKAPSKFFFHYKANRSNNVDASSTSSSRIDKQELISNQTSPPDRGEGEKKTLTNRKKGILRGNFFSSGTSSSSTTSSSLSTLGSEPKSYRKYLSSARGQLEEQQMSEYINPKETLKRHNSTTSIVKPSTRTNRRFVAQTASSSSDLLDSSSDDAEDDHAYTSDEPSSGIGRNGITKRLKIASSHQPHEGSYDHNLHAKNLHFRDLLRQVSPLSRVVHSRVLERGLVAPPGKESGSEPLRNGQRRSRARQRMSGSDHRRSYSDPLYEYLEENLKKERRRRHSGGGIPASDEGMKDSQPQLQLIPESGDLTVNELREMATRQQQHIESQQQLLVAREQRLKYLKQQEGRTSQVNMETERLRRLRERVEAQEAKLRRLRALRGQVDSSRQNAASLYSDLDAMRHLFSEKEKELVDAAAKVEELTRQLEDVRGGRGVVSGTQNGGVTTPSQLQIHHQELEKLRRELLYRNSVNREASTRVASQRDALTTRKEEIVRIDKRIAELTQRLHRKRVLNQQLTTQISAATQAKQAQLKAVQQKALREGKNDHSADNVNMEELRTLEDISQFDRGKHDPKYQTLPYNTKFSSGVKGPVPGPGSGPRHPYENSGMDQDLCSPSSDSNQSQSASVVNNIRNSGFVSSTTTSSASSNSNNNATNSNSNAGVITRTVHSIPAHLASKGHALAPGQSSNSAVIPASTTHNSLARGQNSIAGGSSSPIKQNHLSNQLYQQKGQPEQLGQQVPVTSSIQDIRANLPPTSLSASFSQKMVPGVSAHVQNRNIVGPPVHPQQTNINKDVENVRALGYPAGSSMMPSSQPVTSYQTSNSSSASQLPSSNSTVTTSKTNSSGGPSLISSTGELQDENSDTIIGKLKPVLPPKPVVPSKPTPPPRQKGDPLASSTESLNLIGVSNHRPSSSIRPQVFRYASQNVILSTYTQQQQQQQNNHHQPVSSAREPQVNKPSPGANVNLINQLNDKQNNDSSKGSQPKPSSKDVGESIGEDNLAEKVHISSNRRIEMPPDFLFPEDATPPSDLLGHQLEDFIRDRSQMEGRGGRHADEQSDAQPPSESQSRQIEQISSVASSVDQGLRLTENSKSEISENISLDTTDRVNITNHNNVQNNNISNTLNNCANNLNVINNNVSTTSNEMERLRINNTMMEGGEKGDNEKEHIKMAEEIESNQPTAPSSNVVRRLKKGNLKTTNSSRAAPRRVSFDPLALLLDASLEGELELVKRTATEVPNPSAANDEGITALHNAICAGHLDIVTFLVTFGCDVNAQDSDGWTPLHCAASCNNVSMVRFLVEHGACVLATTLSDHETAAEKCEQDEEGYDGCSQYLYSVQEKLGIMNGGAVYAVYDYDSQNDDELSFKCGDSLTVIRRGDEYEREWWWVRINDKCGYVPRNLLGLCPRVKNPLKVS